MFRRFIAIAVVGLAVLAGESCNDNDNVTGPLPVMTATATPPPGASTPTPGPMSPTPTPQAATRVVQVGVGGATVFVDQQSGNGTSTIGVGTTINWVWVDGFHSTTSGACSPGCTRDGLWDSGEGTGMTFRRTFNQPGTFPYFCTVHDAVMQGMVIVQ